MLYDNFQAYAEVSTVDFCPIYVFLLDKFLYENSFKCLAQFLCHGYTFDGVASTENNLPNKLCLVWLNFVYLMVNVILSIMQIIS